ncbi:MAG: calcium/sodium antiporter [archaeon]|nr:MAG: calcium/sodium antiporter [archaeon]
MLEYFLFIIGIFLLVKGADFLVEGSSSLAKKWGIPSLFIGLTIVAFGTSMPELMVNIFSALENATEVAIGNVMGSNIANILLVLGLTAAICPLKVQHSTVWKEIPFSIFAVFILFVAANDLLIDQLSFSLLTRIDGIVMVCFFAIFLYYVFDVAREKRRGLQDRKLEIKEYNYYVIFSMIVFGITGLCLGGKWVVEGAISIARFIGVSEFLVSATIIALGTSLPELTTSVIAAIKEDVDLAVGGVVGSNIFNIFWVLGITSTITPIVLPGFVNFDIFFLAFATFALFLFMFIGKKHELGKWEGAIFIALYLAYIIFIIMRG